MEEMNNLECAIREAEKKAYLEALLLLKESKDLADLEAKLKALLNK